MKQTTFARTRVIAVLLAVVCLGITGCGDLVTIETIAPTTTVETVATGVPSVPVVVHTVVATEPAPEEMPTAAPLWTDTPEPSAEPTIETPKTAPSTAPSIAPLTTPTQSMDLPKGVVAMINDETITRIEYDTQVQRASTYLLQQPNLDPKTEAGRAQLVELREQVINLMIDQRLIEQAAAREGIVAKSSDIDAQLINMRGNDQARFSAWLASNGMTEDDLREQIRMDMLTAAIRDQVTSSVTRETAHLHVRHILLSESSRATEALERLQAGENFIAIAREYSEDTATRDSGGDLGFMPTGVMPPAFDEAAMSLNPGQVSGLIQSSAGYQIIQLVEIDPNRRVAERYWPQLQQRAFSDWLGAERAMATILINLD